MLRLSALVLCFFLIGHAAAQQRPLLSFTYESTGCTHVDGAPLLSFGDSWQMGISPGMTRPGAGVFPTGNFYVRRVALTVFAGATNNWAMIGHTGPNGDWMTAALLPGQTMWFDFPDDAAPYFTAGEFFDAHVAVCKDAPSIWVAFWIVPAP